MKPIEFMKEMKILAISYDKDFNEETIKFWYQHFKDFNKEILKNAIQRTILTKKFMPSIAELLDSCKQEQKNIKISTLEEMKNNGYFKNLNEYEKAVKWVEKDIIPNWLLKDMKECYTKHLTNKKLLIDINKTNIADMGFKS